MPAVLPPVSSLKILFSNLILPDYLYHPGITNSGAPTQKARMHLKLSAPELFT